MSSTDQNEKADVKTVVYIEDEEANRQLVKFIFQNNEQIDILEASSGQEGLELVQNKLPQIILLDISLPDISGYDVLKQIKNNSLTSDIPVFAISGDSLPEDIEKGLAAGFSEYIAKPIKIAEITSLLEKY